MADFEPDEGSVERAARLASRLIHDLRVVSKEGQPLKMRRELFSESRYAEEAEDVPINDVLANVGQMATEFALARRWDGDIPCLKLDDEGLVPISTVDLLGGAAWPFSGSEDWFEFWERHFPFPFPPHRFWREFLRGAVGQDERIAVSSVDEAEGAVERNLTGFLSFRFAGIRSWAEWIQALGSDLFGRSKRPPRGTRGAPAVTPPPPAVGPGGGLQVQVSCLTPGLRLHVSPAYFITWVFFGSPTTPVTGYVLPGRYIFAGDGPMLPRRTRDHGVFSIPPSYHPALTRF